MTLVPFSVAKDHLNNTDPADDAAIQVKLEQASNAIYLYIDARADPTWTEATAPPVVQAATLKLLAALWRKRGDDDDDATAKTWRDIDQLLKQSRDPALG